MNVRFSVLFFVLLAAGLTATCLVGPPANPGPRVYDCSFSLVTAAGEVYGSSTLIRWHGKQYLLTADHVVRDLLGEPGDIHVIKEGVSDVLADVVLRNEDHSVMDLALLTPREGLPSEEAALGLDSPLTVGEDVFYCGSPGGFQQLFERTVVMDVREQRFFMVGGLGYYGSSGSGVFVLRGRRPVLVGVIVRIAWQAGKAPMLAESQDTIKTFLSRLP